ncbi:hypothetical protein HYC85_024247 [Camellia sinensis]|uniref:Uncharacterized protein n=1 Tax=Camellia sinensis TaxID=4442 RepID=A0A7J7G9X6_CAMSI|nr:hypothetical protein HYC85_024247 [Camellia sinensis]
MWPKDQENQFPDKKIGWQGEKWSPRRKGGLPPLYHLVNKENKVHAKNEPTRMQSESSGGKAHSRVPRKLVVEHRKWRATIKVVSRATMSPWTKEIRSVKNEVSTLCFCTFGTIDLKKQRRRVMPQKCSTEEKVKPQKRKINKKIMPEQGKVEKRVKPLKHSKNERILLKNNMEEKEQMMATKQYENAKLITDILKGNLGESSDCLLADLKNVKDSQTDFTRRQGDRLITCLGNLADTLDQLCDVVQECG